MSSTRHRLATVGCVAALALTSCSTPTATDPSAAPPSSGPGSPTMSSPDESVMSTPSQLSSETSGQDSLRPITTSPTDVTTGLGAPWSVVFRNGVPLVSERDSGRILELSEDGTAREVAVIEQSAARGEGGLLGLAVDEQDRLFVYYTASKDNRIARFDVGGEPGSLSLGEPTIILDGLDKSTTHNGGRIALGPDGMLYVTTGDAGVPQRAQDRRSLAGKILRMTPDGDVPTDNPFDGSLVWTWGHRNPQGMAWSEDGTMFATEFGQNTWDELNIIEAGKNYGWPTVEGITDNDAFVNPVQQWSPSEASPSGMAFANGTLFVANLRGQSLRTIDVSDPSSSTVHWAEEYGRLRHVTVTPEGQLWVLTNNTDGRGGPRDGDDRIIEISPEALTK